MSVCQVKRRRGLYTKKQLIDAIEAVRTGTMTSVKASQDYLVLQSTIRCHIRNPDLRIGAGRSFYLSRKEETYLK